MPIALLKRDPRHPSRQFKKVGRYCAIELWPPRRMARTFGSGSDRMPITIG
jgi:hypothetical protein